VRKVTDQDLHAARLLADRLRAEGLVGVPATLSVLIADIECLRAAEADAARVIHDLRAESAAYERGRADMLGEVVRMLEARSQAGWIIVDSHVLPNIRALGDAAPPLPPDLVRAENERLRDALRDLVAASCNEMASRGLPVEYRPDTPLGRAVSALEGSILTPDL
jgi:hypothetical protein